MKLGRTAIVVMAALVARPVTSGAAVSVTTYQNDVGRSGVNPQETILNVSNVNTNTFGKLYSLQVDGQIYAQPLYVPDVTIGNGVHNVLYVVTMNNSVYAFDADSSTAGSQLLWHVNLGTPVPSNEDVLTQIGILSTPVIDVSRQSIYVVANTWASPNATYTLHSLDITTGNEKVGSPVVISGSVAGTGQGSVNGVLSFSPLYSLQRPALLELNGNIYVGFGSHSDRTPYHGWIFAYDGLSLRRTVLKCITPNGYGGGVWQSGGGLTADSSGNLYVATGNGDFSPSTGDYSDTMLKMTAASGLTIASSFTPANQATLEQDDGDVASGNIILLPGSSAPLLLGGGKDGNMYVLNSASLGGYTSTNSGILSSFYVGEKRYGGDVFYNNMFYFWATGHTLAMYHFNGTAFSLFAQGSYTIPNGEPNSGAMSLSANGLTSGTAVLWAAHSQQAGADGGNYPGMLHAYNAATGQELWNSNQIVSDYPGAWAKFTPPTTANGKVYLATFDSGVAVYGLIGAISLTSTPTQLSFSYDLGATTPAAQFLNVASTVRSGLSYTATVSSGASWLQISNPSSTTPASNYTSISVNPAGLTVGTYTATISIAATGASNTPITVPVTLTVGNNSLTPSPAQMSFNYIQGATAQPAAQYLNLISAGSGLAYTAAVTSGAPWLQLSNPTGTTPANSFTQVSINTAGIAAGTYNGTITVTASGASNSPLAVPVTLTVAANPLTVIPSSLSFSYLTGASAPPVQYLNITSAGAGLSYTASVTAGTPWLQVSNSAGTTPSSNFTGISINPAGLTAGTYSGTISVASANASNSPVSVPVTLTVSANTLTVAQSQLTFNFAIGGNTPAVQYLTVTSAGSGLSYTSSVASGAPWLQLSNPTGVTPSGSFTFVSINTTGLTVGTYNGSVTVAAAGASNSPATIPVTLTVTANMLTPSPSQLSFSYIQGGTATPVAQYLSFTATGSSLNYTASVTAGASWLQLSNPSGTTPSSNQTLASVNIAGLSAGTYNGTITVTAVGASNTPFTVPVTLTVTPNTLTPAPTQMSFNYIQGATAQPAAQYLNLTSASSGLAYTASVTPGAPWLQLSNPTGTTPASNHTQASINTAGLTAGTYNGTITVTASGTSNSPLAVPVTLTVAANPLTAAPGSLSFSYMTGASAPAAQYLNITSTGAGLSYTASVTAGAPWLQVSSPGGTTPSNNVTAISINPAGLTAGTYNGTISVASANASNSPVSVPVTLTVSANTLTVAQSQLTFNFSVGGSTPAVQYLTVTSAGSGLSYTASVASGASWLQLSNPASATPSSNFTGVSINTTGLTLGTYNGSVTVTAAGASNSPVTIPVTLNVTGNSLTASPSPMSFNYILGGTAVPGGQYLNVGTTVASLNYTASVTAGASWLQLSNPTGTTPSNNQTLASVSVAGLSAGTYNGTISVVAAGAANTPLTVPVTLTVSPNIIAASPSQLSFTYVPGTSAPAIQYLNITSASAGLSYAATASSDAPWLQITNPVGTTPASAYTGVSVNTAGLTVGTYTGTVIVMAGNTSNSPVLVPVTLTVTPDTLTVAPTQISFVYGLNGNVPAPQYLTMTSGNPGLGFTAAVTSGAPWLQVSNPTGSTPSSNSTAVSVNITGLAAGTYTGTISFAAPNSVNYPVTVSVTLTVQATTTISGPVQQAVGGGSYAGITIPINPPAPGNALVACIAANNVGAVTSVSGGGVTWQMAQGSTALRDTEIWYGLGSSGSGTSITITQNPSGSGPAHSNGLISANVSEWSGILNTVPPLDGTGSSTSGTVSSSESTGSVTLSQPGSLIVACMNTTASLTSGPAGGFTAMTSYSGTRRDEYPAFFLPGATGLYSTSWTTASSTYETEIVGFLPSGQGNQ